VFLVSARRTSGACRACSELCAADTIASLELITYLKSEPIAAVLFFYPGGLR
jgi:hypothetical protein